MQDKRQEFNATWEPPPLDFQSLAHGADGDVSWVYCSLMPVVSPTGASPVATASTSVIWRACERGTWNDNSAPPDRRKVMTRCGASPASLPISHASHGIANFTLCFF